ncbi:SCO0607 family lipoprotein [Streptomyces sp. NPDC021020]|uniref:SCO0607 family lipoprotein n=1 Tax=Streptomyces sp. NPDC021020 TaxID=3365109 RepID=UPI00378A6AC2
MKKVAGGPVRTLALLLAGSAVAALTAACSVDLRDAICGSDEYPVAAVGSAGGGSCVPDKEQPPKGSVRYPEGKVPQHVDDKWDKYWQDHALDANGRLITDPDQVRKG